MRGREKFLETLEACERTSAMLLLAMDSDAQNPASLLALRERQVDSLSSVLPAELRVEDLERLKILLKVGDQMRLLALAGKVSATRNLASLCEERQVARQLASSHRPRESEVDCMG